MKPLDQFPLCNHTKDGRSSPCRACRAKDQAQARKDGRRRLIDTTYEKKYRQRPEVKARRAARERQRIKSETAEQRARRLALSSLYYYRTRDEKREAKRERSRGYSKRRRESKRNDPAWRLNMRVTFMVWKSLRGGKQRKSWKDLLPYTLEELREHLEKQFTRGMSWQRFLDGEIHIDHIVPLSDFKIAGPFCPEFRAAWALGNLRPTWAKENLSKSNKRIFLV